MEFLAGNRISGTTAEKDTLQAVSGGWKELGRTTLGSEGDAITVSSLPDKRYYQVLVSTLDGTSNSSATLRLGSGSVDSGSNYSYRFSRDGGSEDVGNTRSLIAGQVAPNAGNSFDNYFIANKSNKEKLIIGHGTNNQGSGAGTAPRRTEIAGKWSNTSDALDTISIHNDDSGNFGSGSECVVLGWDPSDTHTTNFWEPLASVELSSSGDLLDSGTFTAKKYLWCQIYTKNSGTINHALRYNGDTGNNYSFRRNQDGGSDSTDVNQSTDPTISMSSLGGFPLFANIFISNNSANEKITIAHTIMQNTAGAGNAPIRREGSGKWANTSSQITQITSSNSDSGSYDTGSFIKVWGSN